MNIHYKIVEVWPSDHLIVVRYWTNIISEEFLNSNPYDENRREDGTPIRCRSDVSITLPIPTPTGKDLEEIIMRNAPRFWLSSLEAVNDPGIDTSMSNIQTLLGQTFVKEVDNADTTNNDIVKEILSDSEIQSLIEKFNTTK